MATFTKDEQGIITIEAPYGEIAAARLPGGVDLAGTHGTVAIGMLAWSAAGQQGLPPQGNWNVSLVPAGDDTRFVVTMAT